MAHYSIPPEELQAPQEEQEKKKKSKWGIRIVVLFLLTVLVIGCDMYILLSKGPELTPDYAPYIEDVKAIDISGSEEDKNDKDKPEAPRDNSAVGITFIPKATIDLSDNLATFMFQNPVRSNGDMVLQLVIDDEIIGQSGKLSPGKQLSSMELLRGAADTLVPGSYDAKFVILFYDPVSAQRSMLKAESAIKLTVVE